MDTAFKTHVSAKRFIRSFVHAIHQYSVYEMLNLIVSVLNGIEEKIFISPSERMERPQVPRELYVQSGKKAHCKNTD